MFILHFGGHLTEFKMPFTNDEAVDLLAVYFECFQNAAIAEREYARRFPNRRRYGRRVFSRLVQRLRATGSIHRPVIRRRRTGRSEENTINVLAYIQFDPHVSTRTLSLELGITRTTIQNILKDYRYEYFFNKFKNPYRRAGRPYLFSDGQNLYDRVVVVYILRSYAYLLV
jgi:hypothetical protein